MVCLLTQSKNTVTRKKTETLLWKHWLQEEPRRAIRRFCTTRGGIEEFKIFLFKPGKYLRTGVLKNSKVKKQTE